MSSWVDYANKRPPDFVVGPPGDPYMERWWIIPRNKWFNIYLHNILRPDDDRALHDHPWWNVSIVLRGGYVETTADAETSRFPGSIILRPPIAAHRLTPFGSCWTLFITGPRVREWGFHCLKGWVIWTDFVKPGAAGEVGRGCP